MAPIEVDAKIIQLKYKAKQIGAMTEAETSKWVKALLLKIHVITGWEIPQAELMTILIDQFQKKLTEDYPDMNTEEIEYAFRKNATVKDWGKSMNLALIDNVLIPYLGQRKFLSHEVEERNAEPPPMRIYTDEEIDNLHRGDVEAFYQRCRNGQSPYAVPDYFNSILKKDGLLNGETAAEFLTHKLNGGAEGIYKWQAK